MIRRPYQLGSVVVFAVGIAPGVSSCRRTSEEATGPAKVGEMQAVPQPQVVYFDETLHVADQAVNQFIQRAMEVYVRRDYETIRLMWTARGEPISQSEFDEGRHAVRRVTIRVLKHVMLAGAAVGSPPEPVPGYAFVADVQFDPDTAGPSGEPGREIAMTMAWENDQWRLATAPAGIRLWLDAELGRADITSPATKSRHSPAP